jgi:hypothetical protein
MKALTTAFIIILVVTLFDSCYYDNEEFLYGAGVACTDTISSYSVKLKSIIDSKCVACHNSPGANDNFSTYAGVNGLRDEIICRVVDKGNSCNKPVMPPSNDLTECEIQSFKLWQQNGFRE